MNKLNREEAIEIAGKELVDKFERADFIAVNGDPARDDDTLFKAEFKSGTHRIIGYRYQSNAEIEAQRDIDDLSNLDWTVDWYEEL